MLVGDLGAILDVDSGTAQAAVHRLALACAQRGVRITQLGNRVQMVSAPDASAYVERFLGAGPPSKLSPAALETLAIVAYRQPITRAKVEAIRGVNCDAVMRTLLAKSLVTPVGRLDQAGRPVLFGTTFEFLGYLGIASLDELPPLPESVGTTSTS